MFRSDHWEFAAVKTSATLRDVIQNLDASGVHICLVTDDSNVLRGVVTDGDIRRSILNNADLESEVISFMTPNPIHIASTAADTEILSMMRIRGIESLPLVTEKMVVTALVTTSVPAQGFMENTFFVLAGGKGTRLRPLTNRSPKPMLEVDGKPILEHILLAARESGFKNVVISIGYLGEQIVDYFGDGSNLGLDIQYVNEKVPLGTAGPLGNLSKSHKSREIVVINGDVISNLSFSRLLDYHKKNSADATMVVRRHEIQNQFGVVELQGNKIIGIAEKPKYISHINAGVYVLSPKVLSLISGNDYIDMTDLFEKLITNDQNVFAFPMHENWIDVGRLDDLNAAQKKMTFNPTSEEPK